MQTGHTPIHHVGFPMASTAIPSEAPPRTSVIVVSYNNERTIAACLDSVLNQVNDDYEVILVDNASSDSTISEAKEGHPSLRVYILDRNHGFPTAVNYGAERALGEFLTVINPDAEVDVHWLDELVRVLEDRVDAGAVTSKVLLHDSNMINALGMDIHISGLGLNRGFGNSDDTQDLDVREVPSIHGSSFACRRDLFLKLAGLDDSYFLYEDDVDLSLRIRLAGYSIYMNPKSRVYHRYYLEISPEKFYYLERNRILTLLGNLRIPTLLYLLPLLAAVELLSLAYSVLRGRAFFHYKLRAWVGVIASFQGIAEKKRRNRTIRRISDWKLIRLFTVKVGTAVIDHAFGNAEPRQLITI